MSREFITIPIRIIRDKRLSAAQKILLAEIMQLSMTDRGCIASNRHFSEVVGVAKETISKHIKYLSDNDYISIKRESGSRNHLRELSLNETLSPPKENVKPPLTKSQETKGNRQSNRQSNSYESFILNLKKQVPIPSKVTNTKNGKKLFQDIADTNHLINEYISYQQDKKEFAIRITDYMENYLANPIEERRWMI